MEEYFLKNSLEEIFMLYINEPSIIIGKHQNLYSEINLPYVLANNIHLARRISGGGTVYQDLYNLNFSFIHESENLNKINFAKYTSPVLDSIRDMGVNAQFSGRNDFLIETKKVSGNAMHIFKTRVLSHGTLLFNSNLKVLSAALRNNPEKYFDKSIKSVRSKVTNISDYLADRIPMDLFVESLFQNILTKIKDPYLNSINDQETKSIKNISTQKFQTFEWIYGYSPKYIFHNSFKFIEEPVRFCLNIEKGIIRSYQILRENKEDFEYQSVFEILVDSRHEFNSIMELLKGNEILNSNLKFSLSDFCIHLF